MKFVNSRGLYRIVQRRLETTNSNNLVKEHYVYAMGPFLNCYFEDGKRLDTFKIGITCSSAKDERLIFINSFSPMRISYKFLESFPSHRDAFNVEYILLHFFEQVDSELPRLLDSSSRDFVRMRWLTVLPELVKEISCHAPFPDPADRENCVKALLCKFKGYN